MEVDPRQERGDFRCVHRGAVRRLLSSVVVALSVGLTTQSSAQSSCDLSLWDCTLGAHRTGSGNSAGGTSHGTCDQCLDFGAPADAAVCHPCGNQDLDDLQREALASAVKAAAVGDINALLKVARSTRGFVVYNAERDAVQVTSTCDRGRVVASFPVESTAQRFAAQTLPRASTLTPLRLVAMASIR